MHGKILHHVYLPVLLYFMFATSALFRLLSGLPMVTIITMFTLLSLPLTR